MYEKLIEQLQVFSDQCAIRLEHLETGEVLFAHRDEEVLPAASTIKLAVMLEAMHRVAAGHLDLNEQLYIQPQNKVAYSMLSHMSAVTCSVNDLILLMMSLSDNCATNVLIDYLGMAAINERIGLYGLKATKLQRKMMDFEARAKGLENLTTLVELVKLLRIIHEEGAAYGLKESHLLQMRQYMSTGTLREAMDKYLPEGLTVAHKTGELEHLNLDAGLIYAKAYFDHLSRSSGKPLQRSADNFVLVVAGQQFKDNIEGRECIAKIGRAVFEAIEEAMR